MTRLRPSFLRDRDGAVVVEFALIAPVLLGMFFGVLQIGLGMQNYNALRGISADVARYAVVNYQTSNKLTASQLQDYARSVATQAPYTLINSRFSPVVSLASTQRVTGATEYTITLTYRVPSLLGMLDIAEIPLSYSRPVFLLNS